MVCEKIGCNLAAAPHQFLNRGKDVKRGLVKLDCDSITHAKNISVVFAAIPDAMFREQLRIDLVPPRLGVGDHAV
jgi:hypothetical protein